MDEAKDAGPRRCGTCMHFEPSTTWQRGWCRNSLLFGPGQSQSVLQDDLFCRTGNGDFWDPHRSPGDDSPETAGHANVKRPSLSPLRLFEPAPAFPHLAGASAAGGTMMFARSGGGSGSNGGGRRPDDIDPDYDDFDGGAFDDDPEVPASPPRRGRSAAAGGQGGSAGGRQRTVQFQPEERYWTEYLRIALPVIGLLLMLGLFWFWAQQLIGDNDNKEPSATTAPGVVVTPTESLALPTATVEVTVPEATTQVVAPTVPPTTAPQPTQPESSPTAASTGTIEIGGTVVTNDADVNLRAEPSTAGDPITTLAQGTSLTVIGGPQEAEGYTWWNVEDGNGNTGWVVQDFIDPSAP